MAASSTAAAVPCRFLSRVATTSRNLLSSIPPTRATTRRSLLLSSTTTTICAAAMAGTASCKVVDSHLHVWSSPLQAAEKYPFFPGQEPTLRGDVDFLLQCMDEAGVDGALIVQPINHMFDHSLVTSVLKKYPSKFIGCCLANPADDGSGIKQLEHLIVHEKYRAVRFNPNLWPSDQKMTNEVGRLLFAKAGELGAPVGIMVMKVVIEERRKVFKKLIEAYAASLRTLAKAQLEVNNQSAEIAKLRASVPMVDDLQGHIAELSAETTRLQGVEADLSRTVQALRFEMAALKKTHLADLAAVTAAGDTFRVERDAAVAAREAMQAERDEALAARDALWTDRDEHIAKYEDLEKRNYDETTRLRRKAKGFCDAMVEIDSILSEAWPESEEAAYAAVAKSREEAAATGGTVRTETDVWTRQEYIIGTAARIPVIKGVALSFKLGILKIAELLWPPTELKVGLQRMKQVANSSAETFEPEIMEGEDSVKGEAPNATTEQTRILLKAIPRRIDVLLDSAGRTGAQTALQTVLSWYPTVKLPRLFSIRDDAASLFEQTYTEVNRLDTTMVNWFSPYDYTPYLDEAGNPLAPTSIAGLADDSLNSSIRPYDDPAPQPTRSSSGFRYRNSKLSDSGSSHTSPRSKHAGAESTEVQKETDATDAQVDSTATSTPPAAPTS